MHRGAARRGDRAAGAEGGATRTPRAARHGHPGQHVRVPCGQEPHTRVWELPALWASAARRGHWRPVGPPGPAGGHSGPPGLGLHAHRTATCPSSHHSDIAPGEGACRRDDDHAGPGRRGAESACRLAFTPRDRGTARWSLLPRLLEGTTQRGDHSVHRSNPRPVCPPPRPLSATVSMSLREVTRSLHTQV